MRLAGQIIGFTAFIRYWQPCKILRVAAVDWYGQRTFRRAWLIDCRRGGRPRNSSNEALLSAYWETGNVHQGIALLADPLADVALADICGGIAPDGRATLLVLDQVTDPRNVGAALRAAAAFGARAVVLTERNAPPTSGTLAKAAAGALETVPLIRAKNLARALGELEKHNFWRLGLDGSADMALGDADTSGRIALVLGAEGAGLRRLTREACDLLVRIPTTGAMQSLNVSAAAAVALYALNQ